jgi:hypothetical protein
LDNQKKFQNAPIVKKKVIDQKLDFTFFNISRKKKTSIFTSKKKKKKKRGVGGESPPRKKKT